MGFTVQQMAATDSSNGTAKWAVVLDHEHVLLVGSYQECEEWLDRYEVIEVDTARQREQQPLPRPFSNWALGLFRGRHWRALYQRAQAFLSGTSGHCGGFEAIGMAAGLVIVYVVTMFSVWTMAADRAVLYSALLRMPASARATKLTSPDRNCTCQPESLDIACDIATPAEPQYIQASL